MQHQENQSWREREKTLVDSYPTNFHHAVRRARAESRTLHTGASLNNSRSQHFWALCLHESTEQVDRIISSSSSWRKREEREKKWEKKWLWSNKRSRMPIELTSCIINLIICMQQLWLVYDGAGEERARPDETHKLVNYSFQASLHLRQTLWPASMTWLRVISALSRTELFRWCVFEWFGLIVFPAHV